MFVKLVPVVSAVLADVNVPSLSLFILSQMLIRQKYSAG